MDEEDDVANWKEHKRTKSSRVKFTATIAKRNMRALFN